MKRNAMRPQAAAMTALLDEPRLQGMPGCGDGMGARLIEEAGFRTGFVSGSSVSAMRLAMPDMDLVSFNEMADAVESCITAAPNVLWLADGDTGHGNALAVQKIVRAYARRGAAAVLIEDKIWPRPLGREGAKLVVDRLSASTVPAYCRSINRPESHRQPCPAAPAVLVSPSPTPIPRRKATGRRLDPNLVQPDASQIPIEPAAPTVPLLPAISCLGAFQTPAARARRGL